MSGDHSGSDQETATIDDHTVYLPAYLSYLSVGFRFISTIIIVLMASWIIVTIKTTKSLQKIHYIYVAHLLATNAIYVLIRLAVSTTLVIGYFTETGNFISCHVSYFFYFPLIVISLTYVTISVDKLIAITSPLRYSQIMKPQVVFGIITSKWIVAVVLFAHNLFNPNVFTHIAKFGMCIPNGKSHMFTHILPVLFAYFFTIVVNIYLTIKAYRVQKQIEEESKLSGGHTGESFEEAASNH